MATIDTVWRARDTKPGDIDAALRASLAQIHRDNAGYVPARVLNLVCVVDKQYSGEIANRLRRVGRYHPSRTIVCSVDPKRTTLDAVATIAAPSEVREGEIGLLRETVVVECGTQHLKNLDRIVDPLVVTDLLTCVWAPHGHGEAVDSLLDLSQIVLLDSVDEPDPAEALHRARDLSEQAYVVDLAWLRSTPWRERLAATFDPDTVRPELNTIDGITIRHHPESTAAALLLVGWLASRLGWRIDPLFAGRGGVLEGKVRARRQDVKVRLEPDAKQHVRGLAGLTISTASGRTYSLDRGPGGLRAHFENRRGETRDWTILGASRGEAGILGEGIRQALLRDGTYGPALACANGLLR
ncbi:MAG TPA: glucose-6-phosphate dehydrogenase assembly protein OpcA [Baekduia sp.]|uniref:glucose-6-phosphate dehydrogenase assembly protein OpcA n=1 Tax=Baekduia sp. TaxID=2600305 RepID=UPI002D772441|nr:glucose-6-phosphate dehydrogenase assembly protein OpcA [Baekduia sp.]HET6506596.1 glucose-6-phosphate dehydrogenase assembly protein OpcA [Baekduia sp.]